MNSLEAPPLAADVEGTRTQEPGGLATIRFPRCAHCRRMKDDLVETLAERDRLAADRRIEAGIVARQQAREESVSRPRPSLLVDTTLAFLRADLAARKDAALDRMAEISKGARPVEGETYESLATVAHACDHALRQLPAWERHMAGVLEIVESVRRGFLAAMKDDLERRFSGAAEVLRMVVAAGGV